MAWLKHRREVLAAELEAHSAGFPDFGDLVDPGPLRSLACHIIEPFREPRGWNLAQAAAIFDFVKRNVAYDAEKWDALARQQPTTIYRPSYTLELGRGICSDQALLVASLFAAVFIPCTMIVADAPLGPHLLTALPVGSLGAWQVSDAVGHARGRRDRTLQPWVFDDVGGPATVADTVAGEYLGDYPSQVRLGTVVESGGQSSWRKIIATFLVHA